MNRLLSEYRAFLGCPRNVRVLLISDCLYALVLPVIEIFVAAFVLRATQDTRFVLLYQVSIYVATPIAFLLNGYLLRHIPSKFLYAGGMFGSGGALFVLMSCAAEAPLQVVACGIAMGLATGLFWANRGLLAVANTNDTNRNYFYGVETAALTLTSVLVPLMTGLLLESRGGSANGGVLAGYRIMAVFAMILTAIAAALVVTGEFTLTRTTNFLAFRFQRLWYRLLVMAGLRGLTQGYIVTAPAMLVLRMVGREGTLGKIEAIGGCATALLAYELGRKTHPRHRVLIFGVGAGCLWLGSLATGIWFTAASVLVFMGCLIVAKPLIDFAYGPMQFRTIDLVSRAEGRETYTYVMSHELGVFAGRAVGCGLFLLLAAFVSETAALRYALPIVASLQLPAILIARKLPV